MPMTAIFDHDSGYLYIRNSKILYFTRLPKTGIKSFVHLTNETKKENIVDVHELPFGMSSENFKNVQIYHIITQQLCG